MTPSIFMTGLIALLFVAFWVLDLLSPDIADWLKEEIEDIIQHRH